MWIPPAYSPLSPGTLARGLLSGSGSVEELEARLAAWYGADRALGTASGTQALQLALRSALDESGGQGPVALPAFNCFDLVTAAVWAGAPVLFYDLDPLTLAPTGEELARVVERAGVLVVANLLGFPLDWDTIRSVSASRRIPVVEDAAQGLGAAWGGRPAGSLGDFSILSFGRGKGWTGGGGGAVLARRGWGASLPRVLPESPSARLAGYAKGTAVWLLARPSLYGIPARLPALGLGETHYKPPVDPARISSFGAGLALATREASLDEVATRRRAATTLRALARELAPGTELPMPLAGGESGDLRLPLLVAEAPREDHRAGVYASYPRVLSELEPVLPLLEEQHSFPGALRLAAELVTAPTHSRAGRGPGGALRKYLEAHRRPR